MPVCLLFPLPNLQGLGRRNMPHRVREGGTYFGGWLGQVRSG